MFRPAVLTLVLLTGAYCSPGEYPVVFNLKKRPLHMTDVIMSLLQGTNKEDERTADLKAEQALKSLQLSSPCGWFWHAHGEAAPAVSASTFLDKGEQPTRAASQPMSILQYEEPIELRHHKLFNTQLPSFSALNDLTPHQWNFVKALTGHPGHVSLESMKYPGHYVHHVVSPGAEQTYRLMMSHRSQISDDGDASWMMGNGYGKYNHPVMVTFRTTNLDDDHHIAHHCSRTTSGNLNCDLILTPRPGTEKLKAESHDSGFEIAREMAKLKNQASADLKEVQGKDEKKKETSIGQISTEETQLEPVSEASTPPKVKDFDNAAAFYIHNLISV